MGNPVAATGCMVMAAWAVPLLIFFGYLCHTESMMIEMAPDKKPDAAWGCYGAAFLWALTFLGAWQYKERASRQARDVMLGQELTNMSAEEYRSR